MREGGILVAPAVVDLILGPIAEEQLRRALTLSEGDPSILLSSPITVVLWVALVASVVSRWSAGHAPKPLIHRRAEHGCRMLDYRAFKG